MSIYCIRTTKPFCLKHLSSDELFLLNFDMSAKKLVETNVENKCPMY